MDRTAFEAELKAGGYEPVERRMDANQFNPEHMHEFDARVMLLDGEMTITRNGMSQVFGPGDVCEIAAGTPHTEQCGPGGGSSNAQRRGAISPCFSSVG
jgi:mannose-6-phosphate isomerase-like protein (cupin superfamily)